MSESPEIPTGSRPRRRRRLLLTLAPAALLGAVAGLATGYTVQADRAPAPLPPLNQEQLAYPAKPAPASAAKPLPAKDDHRVKTDGDLRKLLLEKPRGAETVTLEDAEDGWLSVTDGGYGEISREEFISHTQADIRRTAVRSWTRGSRGKVEIQLIQFRNTKSLSIIDSFQSAQDATWMYRIGDESVDATIERSNEGRYFAHPPSGDSSEPDVVAGAFAWRGDIFMTITITDTTPVGEKEIARLAERQWERL